MKEVASVGDAEIAGKVIHALTRDGRLNVADVVQVSVEGGVVQLTGTVGSAEEKQVARDLARSAPGVKEVRDSLVVVMRATSTDAGLAAEAERAIRETPGLDSKKVGVRVADGIATLVGQVPDAAARQKAEAAVGDVTGIKQVVSNLLVGEAYRDDVIEIVDDADLRAKVGLALTENGIVVFDDETVVSNGVVYLRGHVFSKRDAEEAERLALEVDGVQAVRNQLVAEMESPSRSPNEELAAKVMAELGRTPDATPTYVKAIAYGGDVYLSGHVDAPRQQRAAIAAARRVPGVQRVLSSITITDRTSTRSDDKGVFSRRRVRHR